MERGEGGMRTYLSLLFIHSLPTYAHSLWRNNRCRAVKLPGPSRGQLRRIVKQNRLVECRGSTSLHLGLPPLRPVSIQGIHPLIHLDGQGPTLAPNSAQKLNNIQFKSHQLSLSCFATRSLLFSAPQLEIPYFHLTI
jgi:hypothetical protein